MTTHRYATRLDWAGSTASYDSYDRTHAATVGDQHLRVSADPAFLGDPSRLNPEQMLVLAASSCQLLSFLAVAARSGVEVLAYADDAVGEMPEDDRPVRITRITLRPRVRVRGADVAKVERLLRKAHDQCYIANSLNSQIVIDSQVEVV